MNKYAALLLLDEEEEDHQTLDTPSNNILST